MAVIFYAEDEKEIRDIVSAFLMLTAMSALETVVLLLCWINTRMCTASLKRVEYFISVPPEN